MKHYPILFTFRDKVLGNGFLADVSVRGRALVEASDDGWWFYAVEPGDVAAEGHTFAEAGVEFPQALRAILFDIANEAKDYAGFKTDVKQWFKAVNDSTASEWAKARAAVQAGETAIAQDLSGLPVVKGEVPLQARIERIDPPQSKNNVLDRDPPVALAA